MGGGIKAIHSLAILPFFQEWPLQFSLTLPFTWVITLVLYLGMDFHSCSDLMTSSYQEDTERSWALLLFLTASFCSISLHLRIVVSPISSLTQGKTSLCKKRLGSDMTEISQKELPLLDDSLKLSKKWSIMWNYTPSLSLHVSELGQCRTEVFPSF